MDRFQAGEVKEEDLQEQYDRYSNNMTVSQQKDKPLTRQSKQCGFCIYIFDQSKSKVRLVKAEKVVLTGLVFARKIARMILIQNI